MQIDIILLESSLKKHVTCLKKKKKPKNIEKGTQRKQA